MAPLTAFAIVYAVGIAIGLRLSDGPWTVRLGLAMAWPIGPAAFLLTIVVLLAASLIAFPLWGIAVVALVLVWWLAT